MGHGFLGSDEVPELVLVVGGSPRTSPTLNRGTVSAAPDMVREHEISNRPLANGPGLLRHLPIVKIDIGYEGQCWRSDLVIRSGTRLVKGVPARKSRTGTRLVSPTISHEKKKRKHLGQVVILTI